MIRKDNIQTIYIWKLTHIMYDGQHEEIVNYGCRDESIEMFIDEVIPSSNSNIDRDMWDMQEALDMLFPDKKYRFEYEEIDIRLDELKVV